MDSKPIRVLVIEDEADFAEFVQHLLSQPVGAPAFQVETAGCLAAGLERLARGGIDLVLLDLMLPDSEGLETLDRVLSASPHVAVVILSGLTDDELALTALRHGAQDYLIKGPMKVQSLQRTVRHALERKCIQDRLQELSQAVQQSPSITVITDLQGNIEYVNPRFSQVTGYAPEEVLGRNPRILQSGQTPPDVYREMWQRITAGKEWRGELVNRRKSGELYWEAASISPVRDAQGRMTHFVKVAEDITERKRAEEELRRARDELERLVQERTAELQRKSEALKVESFQRRLAEEADQIKTRFVADISHELRTLLSAITLLSGNLDMLYDRLSDEKRRQMIRDIREQARSLNDVIGNVLDISRLDSGRVSMERQRVDLLEITRAEVAKQMPVAQRKAQDVVVTGHGRLTLWANEEQLRQVIRNLLNNAIKYTPEGGRITCECVEWPGRADPTWPGSDELPAGRWVALRVIDTGPGISAEHLPHIFERFYRAGSANGTPGTGLGLAIAHELVVLHGGRIAVSSQVGQGSTFALYLPADRRKKASARRKHDATDHPDRR